MSRRTSVSVVICALFIPSYSLAQEPDEAVVQEIRQLEGELTNALLERDAATLDRLWHDDLSFIARNGSQFTKSERIAGQAASRRQPGETNVNDAVTVRIIGDAAVTTVLSTWTFPSESGPVPGHYRALHVWVRDHGRWQLLAAQVAMLPP